MDTQPQEASLSSFTTVTPVSKALAIALFVILPLLGFLLGTHYGGTLTHTPTPAQPIHVEPTYPDAFPPGVIEGPPNYPDPASPMVTDPPLHDQDYEPAPGVLPGSSDSGPTPSPSAPPLPPLSTDDVECIVTNCHGTDVTCGTVSTGPIACTMDYRLGDNCRQYAACQMVAGVCTPVHDSRHGVCESCMKECMALDDVMDAFACESECFENLENMQ